MSYQRTVIAGNLGKDPEVSYSNSGMALGRFSVAVSEKKKDGDNWKEQTTWFNVVCFGKTAENVGQYLKKGQKALVEGRVELNQWTDKKTGENKASLSLAADRVVFLSSKNDGQERSAGGGSNGGGSRKQETKGSPKDEPDDNDGWGDEKLPF